MDGVNGLGDGPMAQSVNEAKGGDMHRPGRKYIHKGSAGENLATNQT